METQSSFTLDNGLTLLIEHVTTVQSAAMTLLVPAGAVRDDDGGHGSATVLSEWVMRGAGDRDSRQLSEHLDHLGLQRGSGAGLLHVRFSCTGLADRVVDALGVYADIVRRPRLADAGFEPSRDLALQALAGIDDEPRQKLTFALRKHHFPEPFGRNPMGDADALRSLSADALRSRHEQTFRPHGAILAIAGNVEPQEIKDKIEAHFGDWRGEVPPVAPQQRPAERRAFVHTESEQAHIGIAYPSVPEDHEDYYVARVATDVLGGGSGSRLFTEVREKRGLCYAVGINYSALPGEGNILGYAGTSSERAQETLDTFLAELRKASAGATADELERAKIGLKSNTIMASESSGARAAAIAHDWHARGRLRTLDEIKAGIEAVTLDRLNEHFRKHAPKDFTIVVVGPRELSVGP